MRTLASLLVICGFFCVMVVQAQPPRRPEGPGRDSSPDGAGLVTRMMTFDTNQDGKLSKSEVTDQRLTSLFDRADEDKDGFVTKEELANLQNVEGGSRRRGPGGGFGGRGAGGPGGIGGGGGPDGGGHGGPGGMPSRVGEILSPPAKDSLRLSNAQRKKVEALQKYVDSKLEQILTDEQKRLMDSMQRGRPDGHEPENGSFDRPPQGGRGGAGGENGGPGEGGQPGENGGPGQGVRPPRPPQ